jgi:hypothetical protein
MTKKTCPTPVQELVEHLAKSGDLVDFRVVPGTDLVTSDDLATELLRVLKSTETEPLRIITAAEIDRASGVQAEAQDVRRAGAQ